MPDTVTAMAMVTVGMVTGAMEVTDMDTVTMVTEDMDMVDTDMDMVMAKIITENEW